MLSILFAAILAAPGAIRPPPKPAPAQDVDVTPKTELSDDDVREHVKAYLGSIDTPIHANQWKALGPRAVPMLEEIVKNHDDLPTRRAKAIDGLAALDGAQAQRLFSEIGTRESEPINVRFAAVRAPSQVTSRRQAPAVLTSILEGAKDSRVRALAAEHLAIRSGGKSCDAVRAQVQRESEEARAYYRRALAHCR